MKILEVTQPSLERSVGKLLESGANIILNEAPFQVINYEGNVLTAVPEGGEQPIKIDLTGWVLEFTANGPVFRQPKSPAEKDRSIPPGSIVQIQGQPRIIGTPARG
jgi:hypothetical protein